MINECREDLERDASESWVEWLQELALDTAMAGTALGLAWFSTLQIWTYI